MLAAIVWTMLLAADPAGKLPAATAKEMTEAVIAVNKALGLENWDAEGVKPCVDRGGLEATIKDVSAEDAKACASDAVAKGFPGLGKEYALGIPMAPIGPVTVFAVGLGELGAWGAYSCDPKRRCAPTKLSAGSKQAKRLSERYAKACASAKTLWLPGRDDVCQGITATAPAEPAPAPPLPAKTAPAGKPTPAPWPVKE